jgi:hypothetical protein
MAKLTDEVLERLSPTHRQETVFIFTVLYRHFLKLFSNGNFYFTFKHINTLSNLVISDRYAPQITYSDN